MGRRVITGLMRGFAFALFLAALGCGPGQGDLQGTVSYKNKPLAVGSIQVLASDGLITGGPINEDGSYELRGIRAGDVKILVSSPDPATQKVGVRKKDALPPPPTKNPKWFPIPEDYSHFDKSGLTFPLKRGRNSWDIELP